LERQQATIIAFPVQHKKRAEIKPAGPFSDATLFNLLVEDNFSHFKEKYPNLSDFEVLNLTEELVAQEFYSSDYQ